jgi:hypothetical protein
MDIDNIEIYKVNSNFAIIQLWLFAELKPKRAEFVKATYR